jgi:hypothetical protein
MFGYPSIASLLRAPKATCRIGALPDPRVALASEGGSMVCSTHKMVLKVLAEKGGKGKCNEKQKETATLALRGTASMPASRPQAQSCA